MVLHLLALALHAMLNKLKASISKVQDGIASASKEVAENFKEIHDELKKGVVKAAGVHQRRRRYSGFIHFKNRTSEVLKLSFCQSTVSGKSVSTEVIGPAADYVFDPGESDDFDFFLIIKDTEDKTVRVTVIRCCSYVFDRKQGVLDMMYSPPERRTSNVLASTPGLTFSFSASGWLFVYQLGVAECLQCHGIVQNPHVRVAGASGGALTAATMMYGCDMRKLRDHIKDCVHQVHKDASQAANLRQFVLEAMQQVVRDGSVQHPVFLSGRVEIAVSESGFEAKQSLSSFMKKYSKGEACIVKGMRRKHFDKTSDAVIALLASATMGISGLPFNIKNDDGKEVKVADGGLTDFMPLIDSLSVKVKPFSDGMFSAADVSPTEFVPGSFGLWPPQPATVDHLYELGFRDMEAWLDDELAGRLAQVRPTVPEPAPDLPPIFFQCADDGMTWVDEVLKVVPVTWADQFSGQRPCKSTRESHSEEAAHSIAEQHADSGAKSSTSELAGADAEAFNRSSLSADFVNKLGRAEPGPSAPSGLTKVSEENMFPNPRPGGCDLHTDGGIVAVDADARSSCSAAFSQHEETNIPLVADVVETMIRRDGAEEHDRSKDIDDVADGDIDSSTRHSPSSPHTIGGVICETIGEPQVCRNVHVAADSVCALDSASAVVVGRGDEHLAQQVFRPASRVAPRADTPP